MRICRAADRGDIVLGWLTKVVVALSVVGVLGFDGISLLHARVSADDSAVQAAIAARDGWQNTQDAQFAFAQAQSSASETGVTLYVKDMVIEPDGTVRVVVHKKAKTFFLRHVGKLDSIADITGHGRARPVT